MASLSDILLDLGVDDEGIVEKSVSWYSYNGERIDSNWPRRAHSGLFRGTFPRNER